MTARHSYTCNLCGSSLREPADNSPSLSKAGIGIFWDQSEKITQTRLCESDNHICWGCVDDIKGMPLKRYE